MGLIIGFVLGLATPIILDLYRDARDKRGLVELMRAEASALARAARASAGTAYWDSTEVRHLATLLEDRYSKGSDRWIAVSDPTCRQAVTAFYMECVGYLALRELYEKQVQAAADYQPEEPEGPIPSAYQPTAPTNDEIRSTYTNLADRADKLVGLLEKESPAFWRAWSRP